MGREQDTKRLKVSTSEEWHRRKYVEYIEYWKEHRQIILTYAERTSILEAASRQDVFQDPVDVKPFKRRAYHEANQSYQSVIGANSLQLLRFQVIITSLRIAKERL